MYTAGILKVTIIMSLTKTGTETHVARITAASGNNT